MNYSFSEEYTRKTKELALQLDLKHVDPERIACIASAGSKTRRTLARIHALGKGMQTGMQSKPFYTIELITEKFNRLSEEEQTKVLIHELLHIPHNFGGGFRHHKHHVTEKNVDAHYEKLHSKKSFF